MKKTDLAYIAGFFDGEGSIQLIKLKPPQPHHSPRLNLGVSVSQANEWIIQLFKLHFGGYISKRIDPRPGHRVTWEWQLRCKKALLFLETIYPYLRLKKSEAELGMAFQRSRKHIGRRCKTEKERIVEEAQRILMSQLKDKSGE